MKLTLRIKSLLARGDAASGTTRCVTHMGEGPINWRQPLCYTLGAQTGGGHMAGRVDVDQNLVSGTVFENHKVWRSDWRVFSENDGNTLDFALQELARSSCDRTLSAMRRQVQEAVLARQSDDGGHRHVNIYFTLSNRLLRARRNLSLRVRIAIHFLVHRWFSPRFLYGLDHLKDDAPLPEGLRSFYWSLSAAFGSPVNQACLRGIANFWQLNRSRPESRRK